MDPQVQASFIPKKSLDISASHRGDSFGILFLLALLVFIASLVGAVGTFLYTQYLNNAIASKSHSLELAQGAYDPGTIQDLIRLDTRLNQAQSLLSKHVAASAIFAFLSNQTLANVSFSSFDYELQSDGTAKITMQGEGDSFSTVALQSDQFGANKSLRDVVFSSININANGKVDFSVSATVDPSLILYKNSLGTAAAPATTDTSSAAEAPSTATTPTSTTSAQTASTSPTAF